MLQASVPYVSFVFLDVCCMCVYLDIAYVSHMCCKCFIWMLRKYFCKCFRRMFQVFHLSFLYVASVASGYLNSRSGVSYDIKWERARAVIANARRGCRFDSTAPWVRETQARASDVRTAWAYALTRENGLPPHASVSGR
jgi:hypothetical protein